MRIIAGQFRSRRLQTTPGLTTRPMPDRVRESVFGMLGTRVEGAAVVDLFAGCGCIGLEALSRGAATCMFVDNDDDATWVIEQNVKALEVVSAATVVKGDALGLSIIARCPRPTDLIFLDPPYPMVRDQLGWKRLRDHCSRLVEVLAPNGFLVLRTPWPFVHEVPELPAPTSLAPPLAAGAEGAAASARSPLPKRKKPKRDRFRWHGDEVGPEGERVEWIQRIDRPELAAGRATRGSADQVAGQEDTGEEDTEGGEDVHVMGEATAVGTVRGELAIPGARGPETHAYGSTAVHWYMKA